MGILAHHLPVVGIDPGDPVGTQDGDIALHELLPAYYSGEGRRPVPGRLHQQVDVLVVREGRVAGTAQVLALDTAENFIGLGVEEENVQAIRVAGEGVHQQVSVTEDLPVVKPTADDQLLDRLKREGVHLQQRCGAHDLHVAFRRTGRRGAGDVDKTGIGRQHCRVHLAAQRLGHLVGHDDLARGGVTDGHLAGTGDLGGLGVHTLVIEEVRLIQVLVEVGTPGFRREFRFARVVFRDDGHVVFLFERSFAGLSRPVGDHGRKRGDLFHEPVAARKHDLTLTDHAQAGQFVEQHAPVDGFRVLLPQLCDVVGQCKRIDDARVEQFDHHGHLRVALHLVGDEIGARRILEGWADEPFAVGPVAGGAERRGVVDLATERDELIVGVGVEFPLTFFGRRCQPTQAGALARRRPEHALYVRGSLLGCCGADQAGAVAGQSDCERPRQERQDDEKANRSLHLSGNLRCIRQRILPLISGWERAIRSCYAPVAQ